MPIYEYECQGCGKVFELLVRLSSTDAPTCPHCSSTELKKKISMTAAAKGDCGSCNATSCSGT